MIFLRIFKESLLFAIRSLVANKLRTFLSLLGITIGIFAIISVFTVIDSLKGSINKSISTLGSDVVYVHKWPWLFSNHNQYPWWKFVNRPQPSLKESKEIIKKSYYARAVAFSATTSKLIKYKNNYAEDINVWATTNEFNKVRKLNILKGRYFTKLESHSGKHIAIIGYKLADVLFNKENPLGKKIKIGSQSATVIGVFDKEGDDLFNKSTDNIVLIPINFGRNIFDTKSRMAQPEIIVAAKENISVDQLINELEGIMRAIRKLTPKAESNFALNQTSMISQGFEQVFKIIDIAGVIIGGFSILVGGFGIANIMFVSVKERTNIIGIQKSIGAKNYFILFQFLFESTILSLIGGLVGLLFIFVGTTIASSIIDMDFSMSFYNIFSGILISVIIGIISGLMPAISASRLNPVEAINSNF